MMFPLSHINKLDFYTTESADLYLNRLSIKIQSYSSNSGHFYNEKTHKLHNLKVKYK